MKTTVLNSEKGMLIKNESNAEIKAKDSSNVGGFTPIELLTGSLGLCVYISITKLFERDEVEWETDQLRVSVSAEKAENRPSRVENLTVEVTLPPHLDDAYRKKLLHSTERVCTIGNTIKSGAQIHLIERKEAN